MRWRAVTGLTSYESNATYYFLCCNCCLDDEIKMCKWRKIRLSDSVSGCETIWGHKILGQLYARTNPIPHFEIARCSRRCIYTFVTQHVCKHDKHRTFLGVSCCVIANCIHKPQAWWIIRVVVFPSRQGSYKASRYLSQKSRTTVSLDKLHTRQHQDAA